MSDGWRGRGIAYMAELRGGMSWWGNGSDSNSTASMSFIHYFINYVAIVSLLFIKDRQVTFFFLFWGKNLGYAVRSAIQVASDGMTESSRTIKHANSTTR